MQEMTKAQDDNKDKKVIKPHVPNAAKVRKPIKVLADGFVMNQCTRCGHKWIQRKKEGKSVKCPKCKSKYWSKQYERPWSVPKIKAWYEEQRLKKKEKTRLIS